MAIDRNSLILGDCLEVLQTWPDEFVDCIVTSPPYYGLRDYGVDGQLGLEKTPDEYVKKMVAVFRECRRVLKPAGTLWLNLGDSYASGKGHCFNPGGGNECFEKYMKDARVYNLNRPNKSDVEQWGYKPKDLLGIPWRVAFALQADGWYLRQDIIWHKPNPMPESVRDRCTKAHEYLFLLAKNERYYYDARTIAEQMVEEPHAPQNRKLDASRNDHDSMQKVWGKSGNRNRRSVWTIATRPFSEAHFATMPPALVEPCIKAGCPQRGLVLDPFMGAGTVAVVARKLDRDYLGIELNPEYIKMAERRIKKVHGELFGVTNG